MDVGIPVGTVFGIFRGNDECIVDEDEVLDLTEQEKGACKTHFNQGLTWRQQDIACITHLVKRY